MTITDNKKIKNTIGEGGCPCGEYDDRETHIQTHCWRTSINCDCTYAGVHYKGNRETAQKIAKEISSGYRCEVKIIKDLKL